MKEAVEYIKQHWRRGQSVKEIADQFGVDTGNLERAFRMSEGKTVKRFIDERRKEHVRKTLKDKEMYGYEIAIELGFKTDRAFYQWVKRAFGKCFRELCDEKSRGSSAQKRVRGSDKK